MRMRVSFMCAAVPWGFKFVDMPFHQETFGALLQNAGSGNKHDDGNKIGHNVARHAAAKKSGVRVSPATGKTPADQSEGVAGAGVVHRTGTSCTTAIVID